MNELETQIGTKEQISLAAGSVIVKEIKIEPAKEGSKAKIVRLYCKHPDKTELIVLSNIKIRKIQGSNETIKKDALWWNIDEDNNIKKSSPLADFLRFYNKHTLIELKDVELKTEHDAMGYLCIKAY